MGQRQKEQEINMDIWQHLKQLEYRLDAMSAVLIELQQKVSLMEDGIHKEQATTTNSGGIFSWLWNTIRFMIQGIIDLVAMGFDAIYYGAKWIIVVTCAYIALCGCLQAWEIEKRNRAIRNMLLNKKKM